MHYPTIVDFLSSFWQFALWGSIGWFSMSSAPSVPEGKILSIVVIEIAVMDCVMIGSIDDGTHVKSFSIMDRYRPYTDEDEKSQIQEFVEGEYEGEHVVWERLEESISGMESISGIWCWDNPSVVGFVDVGI